MSLERLLTSFINMILGIINLILVCFNIGPIGSMLFDMPYPPSQKEKLWFGAMAFIQYILMFTIIGTIIIIYYWVKDEPSIATRLYNKIK